MATIVECPECRDVLDHIIQVWREDSHYKKIVDGEADPDEWELDYIDWSDAEIVEEFCPCCRERIDRDNLIIHDSSLSDVEYDDEDEEYEDDSDDDYRPVENPPSGKRQTRY